MKPGLYDIIKRPHLTEKSVYLRDQRNTYSFVVDRGANKVQIREAVARLFSVNVEKVTTTNRHPKYRRGRKGMMQKRPPMKIAHVTLSEGQSIEGV